jgi:hypothetical protein
LEIAILLYLASLGLNIVTNFQALSSLHEMSIDGVLETSLSTLLGYVYWIVILFFVARLARANRELGAEGLSFTSSKAVWGYIIPILNFFRPYLAMREAWQVSDSRSSVTDWRSMDGYGLVKLWWGLNLAGIAIGMAFGISATTNLDGHNLEESLQSFLQFEIATDVVAGITALVMLGMVKVISDRYQAKWDTHFGPESVPTAKIQNP